MKNLNKNSIDTYDFVVIAAMIGGFWTENWMPFIFFLALGFLAAFSK